MDAQEHLATRPHGRSRRARLLYWMRRYGPQDLLSTVASVAFAWGLSRVSSSVLVLGLVCTVVETLVFYGVTLARLDVRYRSMGERLAGIWREYGPAEGLDLLLRPLLAALGLTVAGDAAIGLLTGSLAADAVFYATAARTSQVVP